MDPLVIQRRLLGAVGEVDDRDGDHHVIVTLLQAMKQSRPSLRKRDDKYRGFKTGLLLGLLIGLILGALGHVYYSLSLDDGIASDRAVAVPMVAKKAAAKDNFNDGWKTINVFYGDASLLSDRISSKIARRTVGNWDFAYLPASVIEQAHNEKYWSSQVLQDKVVYEMLHKKKGGYFIDLAANHARVFSNSYALETYHDWNGLCGEANPVYWDSLSFRKCEVVGAVVGNTRMEKVKFRVTESLSNDGGLAGGIVGDGYDQKVVDQQTRTFVKEMERFTVPLLEVFEKFDVPKVIDFFSLDVEGAEDYILSAFPLENYRFKLLAFERPKGESKELLKKHGYVCLKVIIGWGETLWAHSSLLEELDLSVLGITLEEARTNSELCTHPKM